MQEGRDHVPVVQSLVTAVQGRAMGEARKEGAGAGKREGNGHKFRTPKPPRIRKATATPTRPKPNAPISFHMGRRARAPVEEIELVISRYGVTVERN